MMNREEAQKNPDSSANYRPLSLSTMALCDRTGNKTMQRMLSPDDGGIVVDMYSMLEFLYIHHKSHKLNDIADLIRDGQLEAAALAWGEDVDPETIDEGVHYFTVSKK